MRIVCCSSFAHRGGTIWAINLDWKKNSGYPPRRPVKSYLPKNSPNNNHIHDYWLAVQPKIRIAAATQAVGYLYEKNSGIRKGTFVLPRGPRAHGCPAKRGKRQTSRPNAMRPAMFVFPQPKASRLPFPRAYSDLLPFS